MIGKISSLSLSFLYCFFFSISIKAQDITTEITFIPPKNGEEPETKGAGTRNPDGLKCAGDAAEITAIMPDNNYGLTTQARPEIFFLIPKTSATQVVISFQDKEEKYHEVAFLPINSESPLNSFSLPGDRKELETNINYQWKLTLVCGDLPHVNDPILTGWVKRINPNTQISELDRQTTIEKAKWYGLNGYWYDLLNQVFLLEQKQNEVNLNSDIWQQLIDRY